jgi:hypothetical protein
MAKPFAWSVASGNGRILTTALWRLEKTGKHEGTETISESRQRMVAFWMCTATVESTPHPHENGFCTRRLKIRGLWRFRDGKFEKEYIQNEKAREFLD